MHLLSTSPCVAAGNADYATGRDIDGELWANPPCMGADQFGPGSVTGALTMQIHSDYSQVATGFALIFVAQNTGRLVRLVWDFGDGTLVTNQALREPCLDCAGSLHRPVDRLQRQLPSGSDDARYRSRSLMRSITSTQPT